MRVNSSIERTLPARDSGTAWSGRVASLRSALAGRRWQLLQNAATLSLGTAVAQSVNVAVAPVLTRIYSPADLGTLGLFLSFLSVASVATSMRFELGIVSAADDRDAGQLTWASMLLCFPVALIAAAVLYCAMHFSYFGFGTMPDFAVPVMAGTLFVTGVFNSLRYLVIRQEGFTSIARTTVAQQTVRAFSQTALGFASLGTAGLLWGELIGRSAGIIPFLRSQWTWLSVGMRTAPRKTLRLLAKNRELPAYSLPSSLLDALALNMLVPFIVQLHGPDAGGQFALVLRALAVPIVLIATSVADSFHSRIAVCARETPAKMVSLFNRTALGLFFAGLGPVLVIALGGQEIFSFIFGKQWATAGTLAVLSTPYFLAEIIVSPLSRVVFVLKGQRSKLLYDVFLLVGIFGAFKYAAAHRLTLNQTVWAFSLVNTFAFTLYYFVLRRIVTKASNAISISDQRQI